MTVARIDGKRVREWPVGIGSGMAKIEIIRQEDDYDCGLACAAMVANALGVLESPKALYTRYSDLSNGNTSVWTIDIFMLLVDVLREAGKPDPRFTSTMCQVNTEYITNEFYCSSLLDDSKRVNGLFEEAKRTGCDIQERCMDKSEIIAQLSSGEVILIVLVNSHDLVSLIPSVFSTTIIPRVVTDIASVLSSCCAVMSKSFTSEPLSPHDASFYGHYIIARGYDAATDSVLVLDPSQLITDRVEMSLFEKARSAFGTDNDIISVCTSVVRNPPSPKRERTMTMKRR